VEQDREVLLEIAAEVRRLEADHLRVRRQHARSEAEHEPSTKKMVEQRDAIGHPEGIVVRERDHARADVDPLRFGSDVGAENLR
jgi:hypothetical protein